MQIDYIVIRIMLFVIVLFIRPHQGSETVRRTGLPGKALMSSSPSRTTNTSLTNTCLIPTLVWLGLSYVDRFCTVAKSKMTRSASMPALGGGTYLKHAFNVIVYLRESISHPQAYKATLIKHQYSKTPREMPRERDWQIHQLCRADCDFSDLWCRRCDQIFV